MRASRSCKVLLAVLFAGLIAVSLAGTVLAHGPQEEEAREIAEALACPICQGQSVAESKSQLAQQMRDLIHKKLEEGQSREEILQYFADRYGEGVLREPPKSGFNLIIWWLPALGLLGGAAISAVVLYHWKANRRESASNAPAEMADEQWALYQMRLKKELGLETLGLSERTVNLK